MMLTLNFRQDGTLGDMDGSRCQGHRTEIYVNNNKRLLKAMKMAHRDGSKNDLKEFL
ncbi:MAG: hypothetical protein PUP92_06835 [Rhizonema sp. PD38]|nr:hypothetical protein [Rhizonema sp. PD38]